MVIPRIIAGVPPPPGTKEEDVDVVGTFRVARRIDDAQTRVTLDWARRLSDEVDVAEVGPTNSTCGPTTSSAVMPG